MNMQHVYLALVPMLSKIKRYVIRMA